MQRVIGRKTTYQSNHRDLKIRIWLNHCAHKSGIKGIIKIGMKDAFTSVLPAIGSLMFGVTSRASWNQIATKNSKLTINALRKDMIERSRAWQTAHWTNI